MKYPKTVSLLLFVLVLSHVSWSHTNIDVYRQPNFVTIEITTQGVPLFVNHLRQGSNQYLVVIEGSQNQCLIEVFSYTVGNGIELIDTDSMNCLLRNSAIGDFNNDGKWDLAVADMSSGALGIWLGDGQGHIDYCNSYSCGTPLPDRVTNGDFDEDGDLDILIIDWACAKLILMRNDGNGAFSFDHELDIGGGPQELVVYDFDGDEHLDWVIATMTYNVAIELFGDGNGNFLNPEIYEIGFDGYTSSLTDLDEDGILDYVCGTGQDISIFPGTQSGVFQRPEISFGHGFGPIQYRCVVGDFNGDYHQDVFSFIRGETPEGPAKIQFWFGDGAMNLYPSDQLDITGISMPAEVWPLAADVDLDGVTDVIIPCNDPDQRSVKILLMRPNSAAQEDTPSRIKTPRLGITPSPITNLVKVDFQITSRSDINITIYNALGQIVKVLENALLERGQYTTTWNCRDSSNRIVANGIYYIRLEADHVRETRKILLVK